MRYKVTVQTVVTLPASDFQDAANKAISTIRDNMLCEDENVTVHTTDAKRVEPA